MPDSPGEAISRFRGNVFEILQSVFRNAINLGTGIILILAGQAMQEGAFTVGDLTLFSFYMEFVSDLTAYFGLLVARYRQIGASVERLMQGAPPGALIQQWLAGQTLHLTQDKPDYGRVGHWILGTISRSEDLLFGQ